MQVRLILFITAYTHISFKIRAMNRKEVYGVIDKELGTQKKSIGYTHHHKEAHIADTLTAVKYNLEQAMVSWHLEVNQHDATMEYLKRIAALCIKAGEEFGMKNK